jgi:hypothetical protein
MDATRIGWRLLVTGLLGLLCTGCTPTLSVRDLSMDEAQHDRSNSVGDRGARLSQTTASKSKPGLANAAAARTMDAAEGRSEDVLTRVRLTYYDLLKARRELETMEFLVDSSEKALQTAESLEKRGAGYGHDVEGATDELEPNRLMKVAVMRVKAAEMNMLRVLERSSLAPNHLAKRSKEADQILVDFEWQTMLASLRDSSTELQAARTLIAEQERLLTEATARLWASKALAPKPAMPLPKVTAEPPMRAMPLPKVTAEPPMRAMPLQEVTAEPPISAMPLPEVTAAPPISAMPLLEVTAAPQILEMPLPKVTAAPQILEMPLPKVTAAPPIAAMPLRKVAAELLFQDEVRIRLVPVAQEGDAGPSAGAGQVLILPVISQGAERHVEK